MANVRADLVADSGLEETKDGFRVTRVYHVSGVTSGPSARLKAFLDACPVVRGQLHPDIPTVICKARRVRPDGTNSAKVICTYETPGGGGSAPEIGESPQIEIGASLESARTNLDKDGQLITVGFSGDSDDPAIQSSVVEVEYLRPVYFIRYTRREGSSPSSLARTYVGTVNGSSFSGHDVRTLLCTAIRGVSDDGGDTYVVTYEFAYNPNTWKARAVATNPEGKTPPGVSVGNGIVEPDVLPESNFNGLGL